MLGTSTTFDGVAVRVGTWSVPCGPPPPLPGVNGSLPLVRLRVTIAMTSRPMIETTAAIGMPVGSRPYGSRAGRRGGSGLAPFGGVVMQLLCRPARPHRR